MITRVLAGAVLAAALAQGAAYAAQNSTTSNTNNAKPNASQSVQALPSEISQKLRQDGFSDVKVVPGSFLVSAKDKNGDPIEMVIRPNSALMITQVSQGGSANQSTSNNSSAPSGTNR
jgi:hypothetical protein